jgi:hypothetical protein
MPVRSASARSSPVAPAMITPLPAMIKGFWAVLSSSAAARIWVWLP